MTSFAQAPAKQAEHKASFITFNAGRALFALPVNTIHYITAASAIKTHEAPDNQKCMHKVFDFDGKTVELHNFSHIIGCHSQSVTIAELTQLLAEREQDHINWINALEHSLKTGEPFTKATDPHKCAFGMWYDNYQPEDNELADIMKRFDAPHKRIHSLAEKLLHLAQSQAGVAEAISILNDEKMSTLKELINIFGLARARLDDLLKPVILIIHYNDKSFAIELDNIGDIKEFSAADWLPEIPEYRQALSCNDGFYQSANNTLYIKLNPEKIMQVIQQKKACGVSTTPIALTFNECRHIFSATKVNI